MALNKIQTDSHNHSYEYHRIENYSYFPFWGKGTIVITIKSWKDADSRLAEKEGILSSYTIETPAPASIAACYDLLKNLPEFNNAQSV